VSAARFVAWSIRGLVDAHRGGFNAGRLDATRSSEIESAVETDFALAAGRNGGVGLVKERTDHFVVGHAVKGSAVKVFKARTGEFGILGTFEGELVLAVCDFYNLEEKVVDGRLDLAVNVNGHNALAGDVHIMERRTFNSVDGARHGGGSIFVRCRGINNERSVGAGVHVGRDIGGNIANIDLGSGKINGAAQIEAGLFVVLAEGIAGVSRPGSRAKSKHTSSTTKLLASA